MSRQADYRASDHIRPTDDAFTQPAFSAGNRARRLVWNICWLLLFRPSPRAVHAWQGLAEGGR